MTTPLSASARRGRPLAAAVALVAVAAGLALPAPVAAATAPLVRQLVVFRDDSLRESTLRARSTTVTVRRRRCAVGAGTALAALVRSGPPKLLLRDFGTCSSRARDGGQLFVRGIGPDRNRGNSGWVYKVNHRLATTGAADTTGPFGRGRLRSGAEVTWFFCTLSSTGRCPRTLDAQPTVAPGEVTVRVRAYSDSGRAVPGAGATVQVGATTVVADAEGLARASVASGPQVVRVTSAGTVPARPRRVVVP